MSIELSEQQKQLLREKDVPQEQWNSITEAELKSLKMLPWAVILRNRQTSLASQLNNATNKSTIAQNTSLPSIELTEENKTLLREKDVPQEQWNSITEAELKSLKMLPWAAILRNRQTSLASQLNNATNKSTIAPNAKQNTSSSNSNTAIVQKNTKPLTGPEKIEADKKRILAQYSTVKLLDDTTTKQTMQSDEYTFHEISTSEPTKQPTENEVYIRREKDKLFYHTALSKTEHEITEQDCIDAGVSKDNAHALFKNMNGFDVWLVFGKPREQDMISGNIYIYLEENKGTQKKELKFFIKGQKSKFLDWLSDSENEAIISKMPQKIGRPPIQLTDKEQIIPIISKTLTQGLISATNDISNADNNSFLEFLQPYHDAILQVTSSRKHTTKKLYVSFSDNQLFYQTSAMDEKQSVTKKTCFKEFEGLDIALLSERLALEHEFNQINYTIKSVSQEPSKEQLELNPSIIYLYQKDEKNKNTGTSVKVTKYKMLSRDKKPKEGNADFGPITTQLKKEMEFMQKSGINECIPLQYQIILAGKKPLKPELGKVYIYSSDNKVKFFVTGSQEIELKLEYKFFLADKKPGIIKPGEIYLCPEENSANIKCWVSESSHIMLDQVTLEKIEASFQKDFKTNFPLGPWQLKDLGLTQTIFQETIEKKLIEMPIADKLKNLLPEENSDEIKEEKNVELIQSILKITSDAPISDTQTINTTPTITEQMKNTFIKGLFNKDLKEIRVSEGNMIYLYLPNGSDNPHPHLRTKYTENPIILDNLDKSIEAELIAELKKLTDDKRLFISDINLVNAIFEAATKKKPNDVKIKDKKVHTLFDVGNKKDLETLQSSKSDSITLSDIISMISSTSPDHLDPNKNIENSRSEKANNSISSSKERSVDLNATHNSTPINTVSPWTLPKRTAPSNTTELSDDEKNLMKWGEILEPNTPPKSVNEFLQNYDSQNGYSIKLKNFYNKKCLEYTTNTITKKALLSDIENILNFLLIAESKTSTNSRFRSLGQDTIKTHKTKILADLKYYQREQFLIDYASQNQSFEESNFLKDDTSPTDEPPNVNPIKLSADEENLIKWGKILKSDTPPKSAKDFLENYTEKYHSLLDFHIFYRFPEKSNQSEERKQLLVDLIKLLEFLLVSINSVENISLNAEKKGELKLTILNQLESYKQQQSSMNQPSQEQFKPKSLIQQLSAEIPKTPVQSTLAGNLLSPDLQVEKHNNTKTSSRSLISLMYAHASQSTLEGITALETLVTNDDKKRNCEKALNELKETFSQSSQPELPTEPNATPIIKTDIIKASIPGKISIHKDEGHHSNAHFITVTPENNDTTTDQIEENEQKPVTGVKIIQLHNNRISAVENWQKGFHVKEENTSASSDKTTKDAIEKAKCIAMAHTMLTTFMHSITDKEKKIKTTNVLNKVIDNRVKIRLSGHNEQLREALQELLIDEKSEYKYYKYIRDANPPKKEVQRDLTKSPTCVADPRITENFVPDPNKNQTNTSLPSFIHN